MRKNLLDFFLCPNYQVDGFKVFAYELKRGNQILSNVEHDQIQDRDDVRTGFVISNKSLSVYPITDYVLSALSDKDADHEFYISLLSFALEYSPSKYKNTILKNIERLRHNSPIQSEHWNHQEMEYYDNAVDTELLRREFYKRIRRDSLWHIYFERKKYLLSDLLLPYFCNVLEVGCGNARTIGRLFLPKKNNYNYFGTDISLKRLMLAKMVIPEGDFVQCSVNNLPFKNGAFAAVISLGVLHHLEDPLQGVKVCFLKLSKGGYFLIHEPIEKPKKIIPQGKLQFVLKILKTYDHSVHDSCINFRETLALLIDQGAKVERIHFNASVLRTVVSRIFALFPRINNSAIAWRSLIAIDKAFVSCFCSKPNRFGPGGVFIRFKKA